LAIPLFFGVISALTSMLAIRRRGAQFAAPLSVPAKFVWGNPTSNAMKIASMAGHSDRWAIFPATGCKTPDAGADAAKPQVHDAAVH